ncbi:MAG: spermidine/putrescine ABC transporter substrate-binding protein [Actinomycetota bacterium]|nr:spermidine/putrescine ABC transporter substrate-binding protein [Actinomycetota bacterium]
MTRPLTRRELLERAALGGAALTVPGLLAACGSDGIEGAATTAAGTTEAAGSKTLADKLTISNWTLYIDIDEKTKKRPTLDQFTKETGVAVDYIEDVNDNDEWFGKNQAALKAGNAIGRDITVLTDWMAARMVRLGYVEKLDKDAIPNASNLVSALASPGWDPNREYSLPWQSGLTGIGYDPDRFDGEITSVQQLLEDPKLKGKVSFLTEMPDTMGLLLRLDGADPSKVDKAAFDKSIGRLQAAVDSGQIRQFTGNDYAALLAKGDVWACSAWSGDMVQLQLENPKLRFVIPDEGGMIWTDNMLIPKGGDVFTASTFMNFVYDPKIAAQIEAYVNYICPVEGAKEAIRSIDESLADNPLIFPDEATLAQVKIFDAEAADNQEYKAAFQEVIGA